MKCVFSQTSPRTNSDYLCHMNVRIKKTNVSIMLRFFFALMVMLFVLKMNTGFTQTTLSDVNSDSVAIRSVSSSDSVYVFEPYESKRSFTQSVLAFPATLFNWVATRPAGSGITYAEMNFPQLFAGERGDKGIYPLVEFGGETQIAYGFFLFHRDVWNAGHGAKLEVIFGSRDYNEVDFSYKVPNPFSLTGTARTKISYGNNPSIAYFGSNQLKNVQLKRYARERFEIIQEYRQKVSGTVKAKIKTAIRSVSIDGSEYTNETISVPTEWYERVGLFNAGTEWTFDYYEKSGSRVVDGNRIIPGVDWHHSIDDTDYHYVNYKVELNHFLNVPLLPETRRIGLRALLERAEPISGEGVPFFEHPYLGGSDDLRGYRARRLQDRGALLLTAEYRYPIWDFADVTLFVDQGQVFKDFEDIAYNRFRTDAGFGFHLVTGGGLAFRSEFAFSKSTSRFIISISPTF